MNIVKKGIVKQSIVMKDLYIKLNIIEMLNKYWLINGADFLINGESVSNSLDGE